MVATAGSPSSSSRALALVQHDVYDRAEQEFVPGAEIPPPPHPRSTLPRFAGIAAALVGLSLAVACLIPFSGYRLSSALFGRGAPPSPDEHASEHFLATPSKVISMASKDVICDQYPFFKMLEITRSNLGGKGPDPGEEGIVYQVQNAKTGERMELHLNAKSAYQPEIPRYNGCAGLQELHGPQCKNRYAAFNLKPGTDTQFRLSFKDAKTKQAKSLDHVAITWFDIDENVGHTNIEKIIMSGFTQYRLQDPTNVSVRPEGFLTSWSSTSYGDGTNNPVMPDGMTTGQRQLAVSVYYDNVNYMDMTIEAGVGGKDRQGDEVEAMPRFFTFILMPGIPCARTLLPTLKWKHPEVPVEAKGEFYKWKKNVGERVSPGDVIALTRTSKGLHEVTAPFGKSGYLVARQPFHMGDIMEHRMEAQPIAVMSPKKISTGCTDGSGCQQLQPLTVGPGQIGVEGKGVFLEWKVEPGQKIKEGDVLARVNETETGPTFDLKAPFAGAVGDLQQFQRGDIMEDRMVTQPIATITSIGTLPVARKDEPVSVPGHPHSGASFQAFKVSVGDRVQEGDVIATLTHPGGSLSDVTAHRGGYIKSLQEMLTAGAPVDIVSKDGNIGVIQDRKQLIPLMQDRSVVAVELEKEGIRFKKYLASEGEEVMVGAPMAIVTTDKGKDQLLLAPVTGTVRARAGLSSGEALDEVMMPYDNCLVTLLPHGGPDAAEPVRTVLVSNNSPEGTSFVEWLIGDGASLQMGDNIAVVSLADKTQTNLKAPVTGTVSSRLTNLRHGQPLKGTSDELLTVVTPSDRPVETVVDVSDLPDGTQFGEWHVEVGDVVRMGDQIATVTQPFGGSKVITAFSNGWLAEKANLRKGDPVGSDNEDFAVMVASPGEPGATSYPVDTSLLPAGTRFEKLLVGQGTKVKSGDSLAQVKLPNGDIFSLTAGHDGALADVPENLKHGDRLDAVMPGNVRTLASVVAEPVTNVGTVGGGGRKVPSASTTVSVVPGDQLQQWKKAMGASVKKGDVLATTLREGHTIGVLSPRDGVVVGKAFVDDGDAITEDSSSPFVVIEDAEGKDAHAQAATAKEGDELETWVAQVGDFVSEGNVVAVLRRDGELMPIKAGSSGKIIFEQRLKVGDKIKAKQHDPLILIDPMVPPFLETGSSTQPANELSSWKKNVGDFVKKGEAVAFVKQDGKETPLVSPQDGTLTFREDLNVGDTVGEGRSSPIFKVSNPDPLPDKRRGVTVAPGDVLVSWNHKVGDRVREGTVIATIRHQGHDKALKAPFAGKVSFTQAVERGATIIEPKHSPLYQLESPDWLGSTFEGQDVEPGDKLVHWDVDEGAEVEAGKPVATVQRGGVQVPILATRDGWVYRRAPVEQNQEISSRDARPLFSVGDGLMTVHPSGMGQSAQPGDKLLRWHRGPGDTVRKGDVLATVDREEVEVPIYAANDGKVTFAQDLSAGDAIHPEQLNPLFVVTPPQEDLPAGLAVNAQPGDRFMEWRRQRKDAVGKGEVVCVVERDGERLELAAPIAGHVSYQQDWPTGQVIDSTNDSPAFLVDARPSGLDAAGFLGRTPILAPDPGRLGFTSVRFKSWTVNAGDHVRPGDVVAFVELLPPGAGRRLSEGGGAAAEEEEGGRRLLAEQPKTIQVLTPVGGCVSEMLTLHSGDKLEDKFAGRTLATIGFCPPDWWWWLALLGMLLICAAGSIAIYWRRMRHDQSYGAMKKQVQFPAKSALSTSRDPVTFEFEDGRGKLISITFEFRPLGIVFEKGSPVKVQRCKFNSYARWMGVKDGWAVRKIAKTDVSRKALEEVEELSTRHLRGRPIWPLRLDFKEASASSRAGGDRYAKRSQKFMVDTQPIGIEFGHKIPVVVSKVYPDTYAADHQIRKDWILTGIGHNHNREEPLLSLELDVDSLDYRDVMKKFRDAVSLLDAREETNQSNRMNGNGQESGREGRRSERRQNGSK